MRVVVIIAMYNMERWIGDNIQALKSQTNADFRCFIGDDLSTDASLARARQAIGDDPRFTLVANAQKKFSMGNIYSLIERAQPDDDDVLVLVDGDDRLAHPEVLEHVLEVYRQHDCWMTYGSYTGDGAASDVYKRAYPAWIRRLNLFRLVKWRATHLKTFKYGLWKHIPKEFFTITEDEVDRALRRALLGGRWRSWRQWREVRLPDLLDPTGTFARRCSDKNMTIPMLELAGMRSQFIDEILYSYTVYEKDRGFANKSGEHQKWSTRLIRDILQHKPRLHALKSLDRL